MKTLFGDNANFSSIYVKCASILLMLFNPDSTFLAHHSLVGKLKKKKKKKLLQISFPAVICSFRYILKKSSFSELKNVTV